MIDFNDLKSRTFISDEGKERLMVLLEEAALMGPNIAEYFKGIIKSGRMERRIIDGCRAILSLKIAYSVERIEAACKRGLAGNKFNYGAILNILQNKQDLNVQTPGIPQIYHASTVSPATSGPTVSVNKNTDTSESLRGSTFFNLQNNHINE